MSRTHNRLISVLCSFWFDVVSSFYELYFHQLGCDTLKANVHAKFLNFKYMYVYVCLLYTFLSIQLPTHPCIHLFMIIQGDCFYLTTSLVYLSIYFTKYKHIIFFFTHTLPIF